MKLKVGQTVESVVDTTALVVVRAPADEVTVTCGGEEMVPAGSGVERKPASGAAGTGAQLGKRYADEGLGLELLCVKPGEHGLAVNGADLALKGAQPLPASD
jgi:hypothetical protein